MNCAISGEVPVEPVVSKKTGLLYEKRLIETHISDYGKCPVTAEPHTFDDIVAIKTGKIVKPKPLHTASIPGLLGAFQTEWDSLMLTNFSLEQQLHTARQELSHALYQHDAACRVIARLKKERDEARQLLSEVERQLPAAPDAATANATLSNGKRAADGGEQGPDAKKMRLGISAGVITELTDCNAALSQQRKKRQIPPTLASIDDMEKFTQLSSHPLHKTSKPGIFSMDILHSKDVIATGGIDTIAVLFDRPSGQILSTLTGHSKKVTSIKFAGDTDLVLTASSDKTVRIWGSSEDGNYACRHTLKDHSAEVRAVTVHATNKYFVSASLDSTWCFYDMSSGLCLAQVTDDSEKVDYTAAAFHPDGLILGTGTAQSIVKIWDVKSQTGMRAKAARVELQFRKKRRAEIIIQSQIRRCLCHRHYVRMKKAAITTQCGWRRRVARRELRNLKMAAKEARALQDAKSKLENEVEELTSNLEFEKQMRIKIEEAKAQDIEVLQSALTDIKLQLRETQETKSAEISRLQSALQDMQLELDELSKGLEMSNDLSAENEQLKELVSSLQKKNDGDVSKLSEEPIKQEVPVIDETAIIKLEAEKQQLKELVSYLEEKIDALDSKHDETSSTISEQLKENVSSDYEIVSTLAAENERLKALVGSLEKKIDENNSSDGQKEGKSMLKLESLTEDGSTDNERVNKLANQNKDLNDLVSSLEKKIDETEKKYEEASRLCEERLKQAVDAETKLIEAKTSMLRLQERVSDMETEEHIRRQQALVNSTSRRMSPQVSFTGASENGHHESLAPIPAKKTGTESSRIEQQPHEFVDVAEVVAPAAKPKEGPS